MDSSSFDILDDPDILSDVTSCLDYLQQREIFLFKMMHDPCHKVMLYFLEFLLNRDGSGLGIPVEDILPQIQKDCFTQDMREACGGGSREALLEFLLRYPSLFAVSEDLQLVSAVSVDFTAPTTTLSLTTSKSAGSLLLMDETSGEMGSLRADMSNGTTGGTSGRGSFTHGDDVCSSSTTSSDRLKLHIRKKKSASFNLKDPMHNLEKESQAVRYFQNRLLKKSEQWIPIKSLAGHLSQAGEDIREVVGPQADFHLFLQRHPHVFEIQGELVGLKNTFSSKCIRGLQGGGGATTKATSNRSGAAAAGASVRPKSLLLGGAAFAAKAGGFLQLDTTPSLSDAIGDSTASNGNGRHGNNFMAPSCSAPSTPLGPPTTESNKANRVGGGGVGLMMAVGGKSTHQPMSMSANEYKAVMCIRRILEREYHSSDLKNNDRSQALLTFSSRSATSMTLTDLVTHLSKTNHSVRNTVGWTRIELEEFIKKNDNFFILKNGKVACKTPGNVNIIITGSRPSSEGSRMLQNRNGIVYHVAKLWGIIDLGRHEHVFFDKSIFKHVDDLQKHFKVNEKLYFNAVLAPKESRAKWRATQVWKESDRLLMEQWMSPGQLCRPASSTDDAGCCDEKKTNTTASSTPLAAAGSSNGDQKAAVKPLFHREFPNIKLRSNGASSASSKRQNARSRMSYPNMAGKWRSSWTQGRLSELDLDSGGAQTANAAAVAAATAQMHEEAFKTNWRKAAALKALPRVSTEEEEDDDEDDEDDQSGCSYLRDLVHDIKFLSDEVEEEMAQVLGLQSSPQSDVDELAAKLCVNNHNSSLSSSSYVTIATQTLVTGDVMATQIFHEGMSKLV